MQAETPNSTKPSKFSPGNRRRHQRRPFRKPGHGKPNSQQAPHAVRHEISCGAIIYRRRDRFVEIFFIKDPFGRWTFPKGKPEPGEGLPEAAIRESGEETGLFGLRVIAPLGRTSFRFRRQNVMVSKTVHFFLAEAPADAKEHFPTKEELPAGKEPIFEGKWVRTENVFHVSSYKNSDKLVARALRIIGAHKRG